MSFELSAKAQEHAPALTAVKTGVYEGVIISADFPFPFLPTLHAAARFTPNTEQVKAAEAILENQLASLNSHREGQGKHGGPVIDEQLPQFARQYFGYVNAEGETIIYISAVHKAASNNWRRGAVVVLDGGSSFWQVQVNLSRSLLFGLRINGLAS